METGLKNTITKLLISRMAPIITIQARDLAF